jgi:pimeloyl-ACP methyl ester carboxylesterase
MMDTEEQFILNFIDALDATVGNVKNRIAAVMGGSLGGNMALRLGRRSKTSPFLNTIVAWSVTCLAGPPPDDLVYQGIKGTIEAGCGADLVNKFMASEEPKSRVEFFFSLYDLPTALCWVPIGVPVPIVLITNQPNMWYGDSWGTDCKKNAILSSQFDRYEYYTPQYRRWTIRLNFEMAVYSFQEGDLFVSPDLGGGRLPVQLHPRGPARYLSVNSRLLLATGNEDNYAHVNIYDNTTQVAAKMVNTPGTTLFLKRTGHSIYEERPKLFASRVIEFIKSEQDRSDSSWMQLILDEAAGN